MTDDGKSRGFAECPRCCRPVEVVWEWERYDDEVVFGEQYPRFDQHATCPTCGQRLLIDYEFEPVFIAHFDDEEADDADGAR